MMKHDALTAGKNRMVMSSSGRGTMLILAATMLWGTTGTTQALAPAGASPLQVGAFRLLIGGAALLCFAAYRGAFKKPGPWPPGVTLAGILGVGAYQVFFFTGITLTGVALGTLVAMGTVPVISGILGHGVLSERLTARWYGGTILAGAGMAILVLTGDRGTMTVHPGGIALVVCAGISYSAYTLVSKMLLVDHHADAVTAVLFTGGAILLSPCIVTGDVAWMGEAGGLVAMLHLGLLATGLAYVLFIRGLELVPVSRAGTLTLGEPLTAALLGYTVLGEPFTPRGGAGIALLVAGLVLIGYRHGGGVDR